MSAGGPGGGGEERETFGTEERIPEKARQRLLSMTRLKVAFMGFVGAVIVALCGLVFVLVSQIFGELSPSIEHSLRWKAERGVGELAQSAELGILISDSELIQKAYVDYAKDPDILTIAVADARGKLLSLHGQLPESPEELFAGRPGQARRIGDYIVAHAESKVEGATVGRVALAVSTHQLTAGAELKAQILLTAVIGCAAALLAAAFFVGFYLGPLVTMTQSAFTRLEKKTQEALEATRLKSEFLANMSHELRTPMNGVLGMTELLLGTALDARQRRFVQTVRSAAGALLTVLNDILDFSKVEAGKLEFRAVAASPRRLIEETAELLGVQAQAKDVELLCHVDPDVPDGVVCDPDRLRQVLTNLAGNAVKFTEQGEVVVRAKLAGKRSDGRVEVRFEVSDTGIGIALEEQPRLFRAFSQVDGSLTRRHGGTGLGLAISKRLVEAMGGSIGFQSALGHGSTFYFTVPLLPATLDRTSSRPSIEIKNHRVLVVDDNETNRLILQEQLSSWGVQVSVVERGAAALEALRQAAQAGKPFHLAIVDMHMPEMDGIELARRLRDEPALSKTPLLMLSSMFDRPAAIERGLVDSYLTKPVGQQVLRSTVEQLLGLRALAGPVADPERASPEDEPRLLVAEDNPINQEVVSEMLAELGYAADIVADGRQALAALAQRHYPLVLMDCQMPTLDGYRATSELRRLEQESGRAPAIVIAVTAHALVGEREKAFAAGMNDYLTKPLSKRALQAALRRWLADVPAGTPAGADAPLLAAGVERSPAVVRTFIEHVPGQIDAIAAALAAGDTRRLKAAAHKLKGGCRAVGVPAMAQICAAIEDTPADAERHVARLRTRFEQVRSVLQRSDEVTLAP